MPVASTYYSLIFIHFDHQLGDLMWNSTNKCQYHAISVDIIKQEGITWRYFINGRFALCKLSSIWYNHWELQNINIFLNEDHFPCLEWNKSWVEVLLVHGYSWAPQAKCTLVAVIRMRSLALCIFLMCHNFVVCQKKRTALRHQYRHIASGGMC